MIGRLIRGMTLLAVCFAVGTLIAQVVIFSFIWSRLEMDNEKVAQMMTIARGKDMVAVSRDQLKRQEEVPAEQPSFEEIVEKRASKVRDLELREQALSQGVDQLRFEQDKQVGESAQFKTARDAFEKKLVEIQEYQKTNGLQDNIVMLQNMKPAQAKEQLIRIYELGQVDQVVMLVTGMDASKRKKISDEFRTDEENRILGDILRRIRMGTPVALLAEQTLEELEPKTASKK